MYTLSQIRTRVNALKRKYALELQIVRIHRIAEDFSLRWVRAAGDRQPLPETHPFIRLIADNGFRFHTFMNLHTYLERCRTNGDTPDCWGIIRSLYANHDLDRISCMVDNCHALPEPDPDECAARLEDHRPRSMINDLIYWMNRWLDRVLRTNDAFAASLASAGSLASVASTAAPRQENTHQTSRPWRRRQQRNTPTQSPFPLEGGRLEPVLSLPKEWGCPPSQPQPTSKPKLPPRPMGEGPGVRAVPPSPRRRGKTEAIPIIPSPSTGEG